MGDTGEVGLTRRSTGLKCDQLVANLFGQLDQGWGKREKNDRAWNGPDRMRNKHGLNDNAGRREINFVAALHSFAKQAMQAPYAPLRSLALPEKIGCAMAGGHWPKYQELIAAFARCYPSVRIEIVKWDKSEDFPRLDPGGMA